MRFLKNWIVKSRPITTTITTEPFRYFFLCFFIYLKSKNLIGNFVKNIFLLNPKFYAKN